MKGNGHDRVTELGARIAMDRLECELSLREAANELEFPWPRSAAQ
jgi:hypothetical protein